jgi:hypothetical protein
MAERLKEALKKSVDNPTLVVDIPEGCPYTYRAVEVPFCWTGGLIAL